MKEYICHIAQKGFYAGPVYTITNLITEVKKISAIPIEEIEKLNNAVDKIKQFMNNIYISKENEEIMQTVSMMINDELFIGEIKQYICDEKCNVEYAVKIKSNEYAKKMEKAESEYLRARATDIIGIGEQLIDVLNGTIDLELDKQVALVAPNISPAQMISFDSKFIGGIITDKGSPNSHLSILAGNLEIPYIYGNADAVAMAMKSNYIIIDGDKLIIEPDDKLRDEAEARMRHIESEKKQKGVLEKNVVCKTKIYANISGIEDIPLLLESGVDGVGLFRTEFLFLGKDVAPSEEEQYQVYKSVLETMGDKEVIIRTMDIGSDKKVSWLSLPEEQNPALGLRGIRVSLEKKEIFNRQLRALLRAGVYGNLKIMFPMIASEWEIDEIKKCIDAVAMELEKENLAYKIPEIGVMIETPAAVAIVDILAKKVKFFSIGTNDLTQYTLAIDREAQGLDRYFDSHHEAIFRLIETTIKEGHKNNVTVGICGQLATDIDAIERLIAMGVDELSVPISKVGQIRANVAKVEGVIANNSAIEKTENITKSVRTTKISKQVFAPVDGELIPMNEIPDTVFASGQLGKCIGIIPDNGNIFAPCDGIIVNIAKTKHAVIIRTDDGIEYLLHIGIDTVKLGGKGFDVLVREGEHVVKSQKIMNVDFDFIKKNGYSTMVIMVINNEYCK